jgi:hypothetical protein
MKKIFLLCLLVISTLFANFGDQGSEVSIDEIKLKVELIKEDNSAVTVLDGSNYLKLNGSSSIASSIGQALEGIKPEAGTYTHIQWRPMGFRVKAKIINGNSTYYTKNITVPEDDTTSWELTNDVNNYDSTEITAGDQTQTIKVKFTTPLVVNETTGVNLFYVSKFSGDVDYSGTLPNVTWISNVMEAFAFLSEKPAKMSQFDLTYTKNSITYKNKITLFFNRNGRLLGSHSSEGTASFDGAIHGGFVLESKQTNNNSYEIKVYADSVNSTHTVKFDLDCSSSTPAYSNLTVDQWSSDRTGGNLTTSGNATCTNLQINE